MSRPKLDVHGRPATPGIDDDPVESYRMPLLEHLIELRSRLIKSLVALIVSFAICLVFANQLWSFLVAPMSQALHDTGRGTMAMSTAMEGFVTMMKVAGAAGLLLASPVVSYQAWQFIAPGLYPKEKKPVIPLVIASTVLFLMGAAFGYTVMFKYAFPYFLEITSEDVQAVLSIDAYLGMAITLLVAFGLSFQLPIIVYFLARIGLIDHLDMIRGFRYSIVAIFVVAAVITPPDVVSQLLMAIPLLILYGVGIIIAWIVSTKDRSEETAGDTPADKPGG